MKKDFATQLLEAQSQKIRVLEEINQKQQDIISTLKLLCDNQQKEIDVKQAIIDDLQSKLDSITSS